MENYIKDAFVKLYECFPKGKMLMDREPIEFVAHPRGNIYFILGNCQSEMDVNCKILEWFSRAAYKAEPYRTDYKNRELHKYFLDGINKYFDTNFTKEDIEIIYTYLGNACNHEKTVTFIESGFDMSVLNEKFAVEEKDFER